MKTIGLIVAAGGIVIALAGCGAQVKQPLLADDQEAAAPVDWKKEIGDLLVPNGPKPVLNAKEQLYTVTVPRRDLEVKIEGMPVPVGAGLASTFYFYRCPCGKMNVAGEFVALDYEVNDIIDALRAGAAIRVSGVGPMFIGDRPHVMIVRFQGEGEVTQLVKLVREAMRWTGEERLKPAKG